MMIPMARNESRCTNSARYSTLRNSEYNITFQLKSRSLKNNIEFKKNSLLINRREIMQVKEKQLIQSQKTEEIEKKLVVVIKDINDQDFTENINHDK